MAGRGRAPKPATARRTAHKPQRGDWTAIPGVGWQHGPVPDPPEGVLNASRAAWDAWMTSWVAAHWSPDDLPGLRLVLRTFDQVERGAFERGPEMRMLMDTYGITPKGQQERRWTSPTPATDPFPDDGVDPYRRLRLVNTEKGSNR